MSSTQLIQLVLLTVVPSAVTSFLLCWLMRYVCPKLGYVDKPAGRKAHTKVTPLGGGIAIFLTFAAFLFLGSLVVALGKADLIPSLSWAHVHEQGIWVRMNQMAGIIFGALILLVLGIFDDVKNFGPYFKLIVQFAVAALVVVGFDVRLTLFIKGVSLGWLISILWIVVLTNAFNFLDNADGLSSGVALICALVLLAVAGISKQVFVTAFLACFAGSLAGFLMHNFPPAKIFLGDAGSLNVGYLIAVGSLLTTYYNQADASVSKTAVLIPLIVMAIPLYDFLSVIWLRWRSGDSPFVGDHRHFSHRLIKRGLTPRQMVLTVYLATGGTAVGAIMLRHLSGIPAVLIFVQTIFIVAIIGILEYQPIKNANSP